MRHALYIIIGVALLLFVSCGRQQQAKSIVKDFMEANVTDYSKVDYLDFRDIDSTRTISDSLLQAMQRNAPGHFRRNIRYGQRQGKTLFLLRTKYLFDDDTCSATFYIDASMQEVVAFKGN